MNQVFETKIARLREELNALFEAIVASHIHTQDEADLDEEIKNAISFRKGVESTYEK